MILKSKIKTVINRIRLSNLKKVGDVDRISRYKPFINVDNQYTNTSISPFLSTKLTNLHAFQIGLVENYITTNTNCFKEQISLIDFGDSSGNHIQNIKRSLPLDISTSIVSESINCDPVAVDKIRSKGLDARKIDICKLQHLIVSESNKSDIGMCFETMEHLINPLDFISQIGKFVDTFIFTVPFVRNSRVGMHHLRGLNAGTTQEDLHIFEFCPDDWHVIFKYFGWKFIKEEVYYQYPRHSLFSWLYKTIWKYIDFEGFYGAILIKEKNDEK